MATTNHPPNASPTEPYVVPPLETGDKLTSIEFERRWRGMPAVKHAELVEGIVYMGAAVRYQQHGQPHSDLLVWAGSYSWQTPGVQCSDNTTVRLDIDNVLQPDILLRIPAEKGGRSRITEDGYLAGPPELIAEVAASSSSLDTHAKLEVYRRHGVQEYLIWRVLDEQFDWFALQEGKYVEFPADENGLLKSAVFPGLWLDREALLRGNVQQVASVLQQGLASPAHADFVTCLRGA